MDARRVSTCPGYHSDSRGRERQSPLHRQPSHHKVYNWWPVYQLEGCGTWKLHLCSLPHRDQRSGQLRLCQQRWKRCARSARCDSERGRSQDKHSTLERTDNVHRGNTRPAGSECPPRNGSTQWSVQLTSLTYNGVILHIQQSGADVLTANLGNIDP